MGRTLEPIILKTAEYSRKTFDDHVEEAAAKKLYGLDVTTNEWFMEETRAAYERSFTYGMKAVAAFLATFSSLPLPDDKGILSLRTEQNCAGALLRRTGWSGCMFWSSASEPQSGLCYARFDPGPNTFTDGF